MVNLLRDQPEILNKSVFYALKSINPDSLNVLNSSKAIAVQTNQLQKSYIEQGIKREKTFILPPMVQDVDSSQVIFQRQGYNLVYSGKLSSGYNALEIIQAFKSLLVKYPHYHLHLIVAKIMNSDQPSYRDQLKKILKNNQTEQLHIYYNLSREEVLNIIQKCDVGISWRSQEYDDSLELSTKLLEYSSWAKPVILNRNFMNESLYGTDYPLYANTSEEFCQKVQLAFTTPNIFSKASKIVFQVGQKYMFSQVSTQVCSKFIANEFLTW